MVKVFAEENFVRFKKRLSYATVSIRLFCPSFQQFNGDIFDFAFKGCAPLLKNNDYFVFGIAARQFP
jgi:hypothetical protein